MGLILGAVFFTACSGSGGGSSTTPAVNNAPVATDSNISVVLPEFTLSNTNLVSNVTDSDADILTVASVTLLGGGALPTGYTVVGTTLTIDATSINVADSTNLGYDLNVTVTDSEANVSYIVNSVIQDSANDAIIVASSIVADVNVTVGNDLSVSLTVSDADGMSSVSYSIGLITNTSGGALITIVDTGVLSDINFDGNYSAVIDTTSLGEGNFTIVVDAVGVDGGEGFDSNVSKSHGFSVISSPTISMADQSITDEGGFASTNLPAPTVTNVTASAVYSIVSDPTSGLLTINSSTGVMTWDGDINPTQHYTITVKVVNPDGGQTSDTFNLTVTDNG